MALKFSAPIFVLMAMISASRGGVIARAPLSVAPASPLLAAAPAPLVAPAAVGYAHAVPQNVPPFASRVDINTRALAAPFVAAPSAPFIAAPSAPFIAGPSAPFIAGPSAPFVAAAPSAPFVAAAPSAPFVAAAPTAPFVAAAPSPIIEAPGFFGATYAGSLAAPLAHLTAASYGPAVFG